MNIISIIGEKNLFFTTPTLEMYNSNRNELILSSASLLDLVKKGVMIPSILRYGIDGIPQAHADLESGKTMGSLVVNVY
jgi:NADPH2:quinone reductase